MTESVRLERTFEASAAAVFDAWSTPEVLRRWLAPGATWDTTVVELDFRVGGTIEIVMHDPAGPSHRAHGTYTEIDRPRRLAYTWTWERFGDAPPGLVEVDFAERDGTTLVTLTHSGLPSEEEARGHREGWGGTLENLARVLDPASRIELAKAVYRAYETRDRDLIESLVAADFTFYAPPDPGIDRDAYFARCWPGGEGIERFHLVRLVENGDEVIVTYESRRDDGSGARNTEIHTFDGARMVRTEVYFGWDPSETLRR